MSALHELLDTEADFIGDLRKLTGEYINPLQRARNGAVPLLSDADVSVMFSNSETLLKASRCRGPPPPPRRFDPPP